MVFKLILLLLLFDSISAQNEFNKLLEIIEENENIANKYVLPVNNKGLLNLTNDNIYDYGTFDFIIIGAGTAGSVVANKLSKNKKWKILLLEAGSEKNEFSDIPGMSGYLQKSEMNWGYYTISQNNSCLGMKNKQCNYPRGKVLGGSGTINGLVYTRGNKMDYYYWQILGNSKWSFKDVLPYFREIENWHIEGDIGYHGYDGPIDCNYTKPDSELLNIFLNAAKELKQPVLDYNGRNQFGVSRTVFNIKFNKRVSGFTAYLNDIRNKRKNLNISTNSFITKLLIKKYSQKVYGVEFVKNGFIYQARASKEIIVSAGAINTPQILMLSGIGPKEDLQKLQINTIKNLPVGKYFQDHPMFFGLIIRSNLTFPSVTLEESIRRYLNAAKPLTTALPGEGIGYKKLRKDGLNFPDIEYLLSLGSTFTNLTEFMYNTDDASNNFLKEMNATTDFSIRIMLLHPKSKGVVSLKSNNPIDFPNVDTNFFSDKNNADIEMMYNGFQYIQNLLTTDSFRSINATILEPSTICTDEKKNTKDFWICVIKHLTFVTYHSAGTTRMGRSPKNSVVNNKLLVHGFDNLRVVDAGIFPEITSGHTNIPVFMTAAKISDEIIADHS